MPIALPGVDLNGKSIVIGLTIICLKTSSLARELDLGAVEPEEALCCIYILHETWDGKHEFLGDLNLQPFEERGRDPTNNCFQASDNAPESEQPKVRKCDVCRDWSIMCELPLHIAVGSRECKGDHETF